MSRLTMLERRMHFLERVDRSGECWLFLGARNGSGYGTFNYPGGSLAHRFSYEMHVGAIPAGLVIDHACRTRHCVNPAHLTAVTQQENVRRSRGWKDGRCGRGHDLSREIQRAGNAMRCGACHRERVARFRARRKVAA